MSRFFFLLLLVSSSTASAIVIRHDVESSRYQAAPTEFIALVDMPGEGHGVLIALQWVVTAAHTVSSPPPEAVTLNGVRRDVTKVLIHPGYKQLSAEVIAQALQSGDASRAMDLLASSDDIALIKLAEPVADVAPATLYLRDDELGRTVKLIGKGATGNGANGQELQGPNRTLLRLAFNTVASVNARWLAYVFDAPPAALPLEGMSGGGDSGGPVLIEDNGEWRVAGLAAWKLVQGNPAEFRAGTYGQTSNNLRLSSYAKWIEGVIASDAKGKSGRVVDAKK